MNRSPLLFLAATLLVPALGWAQMPLMSTPDPDSKTPLNGNCGLPPNTSQETALRSIGEVYEKAVAVSGLSWRPELKFFPRLGTPALAVSPGTELNPSDKPIVAIGPTLCDAAGGPDEVGFALAHELAHIRFDHGSKAGSYQARLWQQWRDGKRARGEILIPGPDWAAFRAEKGPELDAFFRAQETEADRAAYFSLSDPGSGFDATKGAALMAHLKDLIWALGNDGSASQGPTHPPLADRAADIQEGFFYQSAADALKGR